MLENKHFNVTDIMTKKYILRQEKEILVTNYGFII